MYFYINIIASDLRWASGAPDGGRQQNFIALRPQKKEFEDLHPQMKLCVSCVVEQNKIFTLRGICKDSYMETEFFPTMCDGYVGFIGNLLSIWYVIFGDIHT